MTLPANFRWFTPWIGSLLVGLAVGALLAWTITFHADGSTTVVNPADSAPIKTTDLSIAQGGGTWLPRAEEVHASSLSVRMWELGKREAGFVTKDALTSPNWRIVGTSSVSGTSSFVLLLFEGAPTPETRFVGNVLPGNARILAIDGQQVEVLHRGKRFFLFTGSP